MTLWEQRAASLHLGRRVEAVFISSASLKLGWDSNALLIDPATTEGQGSSSVFNDSATMVLNTDPTFPPLSCGSSREWLDRTLKDTAVSDRIVPMPFRKAFLQEFVDRLGRKMARIIANHHLQGQTLKDHYDPYPENRMNSTRIRLGEAELLAEETAVMADLRQIRTRMVKMIDVSALSTQRPSASYSVAWIALTHSKAHMTITATTTSREIRVLRDGV